MAKSISLTTKDNPYNPINEFDQWFAFDVDKGYNSCAYLSRIIEEQGSPSLIDDRNIELAIDEIVKINGDLYIKLETVD